MIADKYVEKNEMKSTMAHHSGQVQQPTQVQRLLQLGLATAGSVAVLNLIFYFATKAFGIPYLIAIEGSMEPLPSALIVVSSIMPVVAATILLYLLGKFLSQPFRVFTIISVVALIISIAAPLTQPSDVVLSTRIGMIVMHLISGGTIIAALNRFGRAS